MSDIFMEKLVSRKKTVHDTIFSIGVVVSIPLILIFLSMIPYVNKLVMQFFVFVAGGFIYIAYTLIRARNVEFEYIVTNSDLDIDKIMSRKSRKRIFSASSKDFEIMAVYEGNHYIQSYDDIRNRIEAVSSMKDEGIYFVVAKYKGTRTVVFFQPDDRMIASLKKFNPKNVYKADNK